MLDRIEAVGGRYFAIDEGELPTVTNRPLRRMLGDVVVIEIDLHASAMSPRDLKEQFPEADCPTVPETKRSLRSDYIEPDAARCTRLSPATGLASGPPGGH